MRSNFKNREFLEFPNMLRAVRKCAENVRWKTSVTSYEMNKLKNTVRIIRDVNMGKYKLSPYQEFEIFEPKRRKILATKIRDRQLQRSLCDTYLYKEITRHFIYDNCACQKGKGTHFAINRLKVHFRRFYNKNRTNKGYYLKCDIHHFFESINHDQLKSILCKKVRNDKCREIVYEIIDSFGIQQTGLGLGSQVSQLLALLYLDPLDHYIKEVLKIKHYIRYMDDFILIHDDKEYLKYCLQQIQKWLKEHGLSLNNKTCLQPIKKPVVFLNFKFILTNTGKVIITTCRKRLIQRRRKLKKIIGLYYKERLTLEDVLNTVKGMLAHIDKYNTVKEHNKLVSIYNNFIAEQKMFHMEQITDYINSK